MTREEAREILTHNWTRVDNPNYSESELDEAFFMAIEALQTEGEHGEGVVAYVCDNRKCGGDCDNCGRTTDLAHAKNFTRISDSYFERLDSVSVVRCKDCRFAMVRTKEEMNKPIKPQPILCEWLCIGVENDAYCSHGERREE